MEGVIKKIVLDLGKKQVELTPEQCKKLKDALDEMFGNKVVEHHCWPVYSSGIASTGSPLPKPDTTVWMCDNDISASYSNNTMTLKVA